MSQTTTPTNMVSREPLTIRAAIVAALVAILHFLVLGGWLNFSPELEEQAATVIALVGTAVLVLWTRGKVTPVDDPRDEHGRPLIPADGKDVTR